MQFLANLPRVCQHDRPFGYQVALVLIVCLRSAWKRERKNGSPPQAFANHSLDVGQGWAIVEGREAIGSDDCVQLFLGAFLDFGVCEHGEKEESDSCPRLGEANLNRRPVDEIYSVGLTVSAPA